jgi:hypothetical protein
MADRKKGLGHYTSECWCCSSFRGVDISEKEKEDNSADLKTRLHEKPSPHLVNMVNWFFCPQATATGAQTAGIHFPRPLETKAQISVMFSR